MKILVVNPNSTVSMTDKIRRVAQRVAASGTEIIAVNPSDTPASIEGHFDAATSIPSLIREIRQGDAAGYAGFVVACFDDPGIDACREVARGPVLGICEAAMKATSMIATSFSVVTTLQRSVPIIEELAVKYGMDRYCRRVRAANFPVLALEEENREARQTVLREILRAVEVDDCEAVILGCAGMTDLTEWLTEKTGVPVIDGVGVAVRMVEALVGAGLATSKACAYAPPLSKATCH
jgi:allantoin racemase